MPVWWPSASERAAKYAVASLCSYEVAAITTGRVPTLTALNRRWPVVGVGIVAGLTWHFHAHSR